jgi:hypothetical protein
MTLLQNASLFYRSLIGPNDLEVIHKDKRVLMPYFSESYSTFPRLDVCFNSKCLSYLCATSDKSFYEDIYGKKYCSISCLPQKAREENAFQRRRIACAETLDDAAPESDMAEDFDEEECEPLSVTDDEILNDEVEKVTEALEPLFDNDVIDLLASLLPDTDN